MGFLVESKKKKNKEINILPFSSKCIEKSKIFISIQKTWIHTLITKNKF